MNSVAIHHDPDTGRIYCEYGTLCQTWVSSDKPGVITGMGPLMIVRADADAEAINLGHFGVSYIVRDGIARTEAVNGTWLHRLQPAHWAAGHPPDDGWSPAIQLGRWPD